MFDFGELLTFLKSLFDAFMAFAKKVFKFDVEANADDASETAAN